MVSPVHPDTPHVSAVRAWRFAQELTNLGHRVVFLTAKLRDSEAIPQVAITAHKWVRPYLWVVNESATGRDRLPAWLERLRTAWLLLKDGGRRGRWVSDGVLVAEREISHFRPDVVWCTFGAMEAIFAAKRIAKKVGCPWVLDIKDNWEIYVPHGLRRLMAWRTRGWARITANAEFTAQKARKWQHADSTVIYSGVDDAFFRPRAETDASCTTREFIITFVGSLYSSAALDALLSGVHHWARSLTSDERQCVLIRYFGVDVQMFAKASKKWVPDLRSQLNGYVAIDELAKACKAASVNAYVVHTQGFHHKLLELIACDRPILAYRAESDESRLLVMNAGAELLEATTPTQVTVLLTQLHGRQRLPGTETKKAPKHPKYSWGNQTRELEQVFINVVSTKKSVDD